MTSAYILEESMSSKDDVITFSSYQGVQDLESAMMTSAVMSSQSADEERSVGARRPAAGTLKKSSNQLEH
ncbi:hypothetical protein F511_28079 [Dorcoceras hygrometricum]|uniref:Uncharacterized protein n=1 Tax=Dorcoceras hygrometricum TaxID=472368 RepID=A0A2Z7CV96_9LAMI|nr:hypothetical protein F511_28079 [Dorcoceras hygrometricum]